MVLFEYDEKAVMAHKEEVAEARGREKGMSEGKAEVAKAMLADGLPVEKVSQYSNIPVEELKKLK